MELNDYINVKLKDLITFVKEASKLIPIHHNDGDGISSAVLTYLWVYNKFERRLPLLPISFQETYITRKYPTVIIEDIPYEFVKNYLPSKFFVIDHHPDWKTYKINYFKL